MAVLFAEDEALIAMSITDLLEAEGFNVVLASNGAIALKKALELGDAVDVLLTDLNMPEMNGEDLIRALRNRRPELPVIVVTGAPPPGGLEELVRYGGGNGPLTLLTKPVDYGQLLDTLRQALSLATISADASKGAGTDHAAGYR